MLRGSVLHFQQQIHPSRCRAENFPTFARLPHSFMLHQRRRWFLLVSRKNHWQVMEEQARTKRKLSEASNSAAERTIGDNRVSNPPGESPLLSYRQAKPPLAGVRLTCCAAS